VTADEDCEGIGTAATATTVCKERLKLCSTRVTALERGVNRLLDAEKYGEMGERDAALKHLTRLMGRA
jgi:hypothetical protein